MKWLATTVLCLLAMPAVAEEENGNIVRLPTMLFCGPYNPENDKILLRDYGEIPFAEGFGEVMSPDFNLSYQGRLRMFLDPNDSSYSIFLELGEELNCLVATGEDLTPVLNGDEI